MNQSNEIIPHSCPTIGDAEIERVARVIRSGQLAQGEEVRTFEDRFSRFLGGDEFHAVAVNSGTSALHLALVALGVGAGDEVILPSYVCTALLNAVSYVGARPVLADIVYDTCNIDPADVRRRIGSSTKAIIVPHMFGLPCEMDEILTMGVPVIEDCAQSVGATIHGRQTGTFGQISIFSFYAAKMMSTGEGGMVVSRFVEVVERIRDLREYDHRNDYRERYNYKMTDMAAAMGIVQLERLGEFLEARREIAATYDAALQGLGIRIPPGKEGRIYFRYLIETAGDLENVRERFREHGITCARPIFKPLHCYFNMDGYPETESAHERYLSLPIYPSLGKAAVSRVEAAAAAILKREII